MTVVLHSVSSSDDLRHDYRIYFLDTRYIVSYLRKLVSLTLKVYQKEHIEI